MWGKGLLPGNYKRDRAFEMECSGGASVIANAAAGHSHIHGADARTHGLCRCGVNRSSLREGAITCGEWKGLAFPDVFGTGGW